MKQRLGKMSYNKPTNIDKYEAIAEFIQHFITIKHAGSVRIELELLNGGITAIKTSVDGTLFPVRAQ